MTLGPRHVPAPQDKPHVTSRRFNTFRRSSSLYGIDLCVICLWGDRTQNISHGLATGVDLRRSIDTRTDQCRGHCRSIIRSIRRGSIVCRSWRIIRCVRLRRIIRCCGCVISCANFRGIVCGCWSIVGRCRCVIRGCWSVRLRGIVRGYRSVLGGVTRYDRCITCRRDSATTLPKNNRSR